MLEKGLVVTPLLQFTPLPVHIYISGYLYHDVSAYSTMFLMACSHDDADSCHYFIVSNALAALTKPQLNIHCYESHGTVESRKCADICFLKNIVR